MTLIMLLVGIALGQGLDVKHYVLCLLFAILIVAAVFTEAYLWFRDK